MDYRSLVRDAEKVNDDLFIADNGAMYTKKGCKIYIPRRYLDRELAVIADTTRIISIFMIVVEDKYYGVSSATAMMQITPSSTSIVTMAGEDHMEFTFEAGAQITPNVDLVKDDTIVYKVWDEIPAKGHIPWYFNSIDLGLLFTSSAYHGGLSLGPTNVPLEAIAASISRDVDDRTRYYRHVVDDLDPNNPIQPDFIAFRNVIYGANNAVARLMGSYFDDGVLSSLVNPTEKTEGVETLLRK